MFSNLFSFYSADGTFVPSQKKNDIIENFTEENVLFKIEHPDKPGNFLTPLTLSDSDSFTALSLNQFKTATTSNLSISPSDGSLFMLFNSKIYLKPRNGFFILENGKVTDVAEMSDGAKEVDIILGITDPANGNKLFVLVQIEKGSEPDLEKYPQIKSQTSGDNLILGGVIDKILNVHVHVDLEPPISEIVELMTNNNKYIYADLDKVIQSSDQLTEETIKSLYLDLSNQSKGSRFQIVPLNRSLEDKIFMLKLVGNDGNVVTVNDKEVILLKNDNSFNLAINYPEMNQALELIINQFGHYHLIKMGVEGSIHIQNKDKYRDSDAITFTPVPEPVPAPEPAPGQCDYSNYILSSDHESIINEVNAQHQILLDEASLKCPVGHFCMTKAEWDEFLTHERRQPFQDALNDLSLIDGDAN